MPSCRYIVWAITLFNSWNQSVCISWREGCRGEAIPFAERMAPEDGVCLVPTGAVIVSAVVPSVPMSDRSAGSHACSLSHCRQGRFAQARQTAENGQSEATIQRGARNAPKECSGQVIEWRGTSDAGHVTVDEAVRFNLNTMARMGQRILRQVA